MEDLPMKKIHKHLDLAVAVLTILYSALEIINVALDIYSKVVNYALSVRKLPLFLQKERQADLCA
jgi:hypothetical protein